MSLVTKRYLDELGWRWKFSQIRYQVHKVCQITNTQLDYILRAFNANRIRPTSESSYTFTGVKENQLYKTKQEAGEAWLKSQGLKCGVSDD